MPNNKNQSSKQGHLFTVNILIEEETNGLALQSLLQTLNAAHFKDYRILEGIQLGKLIELNEPSGSKEGSGTASLPAAANSISTETKVSASVPDAGANPVQASRTAQAGSSDPLTSNYETLEENLRRIIKANTLIRLSVVKGAGIRLSLPCRVLNFDEESGNVSVYHVDEKKVYLFKLNEIDNMSTH
ncbi:hypothetical protein [Paenibacillus lutrae]|uniref:Uncharacterized protein n=1 Tax=Paenibacillus lutrae TaxID=2078573 RepID=A0A7X3K054_9BACL|nr:hypothetical protein [Paenibacillus lutrae]MVP00788.1 hypothetical protein [Paenibacillus lutrae]